MNLVQLLYRVICVVMEKILFNVLLYDPLVTVAAQLMMIGTCYHNISKSCSTTTHESHLMQFCLVLISSKSL